MSDNPTTEPLQIESISGAPLDWKSVILHLNREPTYEEMQDIFGAVWKILNEG